MGNAEIFLEVYNALSPDEQYDIINLDDATNEGDLPRILRLLDKGVSVNSRDRWGGTPLMAAAHIGQAHLVRLYLERGADASLKSVDGETPRAHAMAIGHHNVVAVFDEFRIKD